jgi:imidazolonepropionase-like amidohydrolase
MNIAHKVPKLPLNVLESLADEAHRQDLKLMVHTGRPEEIMDSLRAGADSIEHGILPGTSSTKFGDDIVNMMLDRGTYFVPTIAIAWAYRNTALEVFSDLKKAIEELHEAGVNIAAGTDSGTPGVVIGTGLHKELELLVEAGLSPIEAIIAGTRNAADNLGKRSELGTIEEGKLADIIVVSGNPLEDIQNTRNIKMVIKDGIIVKDNLS